MKGIKRKVNGLLEEIKEVNKKQAECTIIDVLGRYKEARKVLNKITNNTAIECPECYTNHKDRRIIKYGRANGKQRFRCKACNITFSEHRNSPLYRTQLPRAVWLECIQQVLEGSLLDTIKDKCGVCLETAHRMRMKVLEGIKRLQDRITLSRNVVYADETYIRAGYKLRCVLTLYDGTNTVMEYVATGNASMREGDARGTFKCIETSANVLITDGNKTYEALCPPGMRHKSVDSKSNAFEPMNNKHSDFKSWIAQFNGVKLPNLPLYLSWFGYIK